MPPGGGGKDGPPPKYQKLELDDHERPALERDTRMYGGTADIWMKVYLTALKAFRKQAPGTAIGYAQRAADIAVLRVKEK
jgi:hypothetical protein